MKSASAEKRSSYPHRTATENGFQNKLALRQGIESRALKRTLAAQRRAIEKTPHPGTWRHFVSPAASRSATPARFKFERDEIGNATVPVKKGSCEIELDAVPRFERGTCAPQVDIKSYYRAVGRLR